MVRRFGLVLGLLLGGLVPFLFGPEVDPIAARMAGIACLMATWWITEAIPIPATALVPLVAFPLAGIMPAKVVSGQYSNTNIYLFLGGFLLALGMQRSLLHRRIALEVLYRVGTSPTRLLAGFMLSSAFLSMWISNTATAMMMLPIGLAVLSKYPSREGEEHRIGMALMLGIAYACSIGGMATLIGTPPNLTFRRVYGSMFPNLPEISFGGWLGMVGPFSLAFLLLCWAYLAFVAGKLPGHENSGALQTILDQRARLGRITRDETIVALLFSCAALLWMTSGSISLGSIDIPGWRELLGVEKLADDSTVAIGIALLLFAIPSAREPGTTLLTWESAIHVPWGILLLFGGGAALAKGFQDSGLSNLLVEGLTNIPVKSALLLVPIIALTITFLTELTSNTATAELVLPILGTAAQAMDIPPLILMLPATLSCSCAFMLPVATPPNAIIFGSGEVSMREMATAGVWLNLCGVALVTVVTFLVAR